MSSSRHTTTRGLKSSESTRSTYQQVRTVIEHLQEQHRRLRDTYRTEDEGPGSGTPQRTELVFGYLEDREKGIAAFLDRISRSERDGILDTWIQYVDLSSYDRKVELMIAAPPEEHREAMARIAVIDRELYRLYERLEQQVTALSVRRFFQELGEMSLRRARAHAESLQQVEDL